MTNAELIKILQVRDDERDKGVAGEERIGRI